MNLDGLFDQLDLLTILQAGEFDDDIRDNSDYAEGDWTGDFTSGDLVFAFRAGGYAAAAPHPALFISEIVAANNNSLLDQDGIPVIGSKSITHQVDVSLDGWFLTEILLRPPNGLSLTSVLPQKITCVFLHQAKTFPIQTVSCTPIFDFGRQESI